MGWNPWQAVGRLPHISVEHVDMPPRLWGAQAGASIWLNRALGQVRRRCTLAHELIHLERGPVPEDARGLAREERAEAAEAARRLNPLEALADALRWTRDEHQLADALWVDRPTLRARMGSLDPVEVAELENRLNGDWLWIP